MERMIERARQWAGRVKRHRMKVKPLSAGWMGASIALGAITLFFVLLQANYMLGARGFFDLAAGTAISLIFVALVGGIIALMLHLVKKIPTRYLWLFFSAFMLLFICFIGPMQMTLVFILGLIVLLSLWGATLYKLIKGGYKYATRTKKISALVLLISTTAVIGLAGYWTLHDGEAQVRGVHLKELKTAARYQNKLLANPAEEGTYKVKTRTYGSKNSYRTQFNQPDSLVTQPVDGSAFVQKWSSLRTKTVGFGPDAMPLNGLVWYPEGDGPFPLVVIVHGNHLMTEYSDPGYDYLGQLLASRGYIFVSIDENFLNASPWDDMFMFSALEKENPARGMLMLEHLKTWKAWNQDRTNPFYQKVDMDHIALIGHSRGGEAITIAAAYNKLGAHPDNGNITFDYNFHIRSIISIAGTDLQYRPSGKPMPVDDVNYLALQGSHDMDVNSFRGSSQYHRTRFRGQGEFMKAAVYIYGANHGQFNRVWSRGDGVGLGNQLFNLKQLMPREEQETAAKVLISSFLDATLKNKKEYRAVFQDLGYAKQWLPDTMYISDYNDSRTMLIASFDEDIDVRSTTLPGGKLIGDNLQEWKEERVKMKFGEDLYSAVQVGWDRSKNPKAASYSVVLPEKGLDLAEHDSFVFSIADKSERKNASYQDGLLDFTIKVEDTNGNQASLPLSHIAKLIPMIEGKLLKAPFANSGDIKEPVFQNYGFPLSDFTQVNAQFNPQLLSKVSFEFDQTETGAVLITDIGIRK
ncbi:MFS transporter [Paenibacillus thiaminolyticus]|uniref:MFS transporter n=1 Tax=Paenibacillus TaxID=44249 RepID=UPI00105A74D6|nr:MFS transporter [Paenibacillus dendritiformis]TDL55472.1 MFS transporter [Paenibacillus dendritiformis]